MTDDQTPPDWVLIEATERSNFAYSLGFIRNNYGTMSHSYRALCDMIAKHEQPPVDRKVLCAREAIGQSYAQEFRSNIDQWQWIAVRTVELWEEGFGK